MALIWSAAAPLGGGRAAGRGGWVAGGVGWCCRGKGKGRAGGELCMPSVTPHPPGMAVPGVEGGGGVWKRG